MVIPKLAAAAMTRPRRRILSRMPMFILPVLLYVVVALSVTNVRATFFSIGPYALSWVEVLYLLGFFVAMFELLRVAHPGVDNTGEALRMLFVAVAMLVLFVLGAAGLPVLQIFNNTEFLILLMVSATQVVLAFFINSATLKRSIGMSEEG
jgi:hypothetical protein